MSKEEVMAKLKKAIIEGDEEAAESGEAPKEDGADAPSEEKKGGD